MIRRPPRSTRVRSSAASDVYKRQLLAQRRDWRAKRGERATLQIESEALGAALAQTLLRKEAAAENERIQNNALYEINRELGGWEVIVKQQQRLEEQAQAAGG